MQSQRATFIVLAAALALALPASAQTVFKLIDKKGKVTYADKAPKDYDGQVVKLDIDPNANLATLPKVGTSSNGVNGVRPLSQTEAARFDAGVNLARAYADLEAAKKALAEGSDPKEGEVDWIGKKGGGARPVPTQEFADKLKGLQDAVKAAEDKVAAMQKAKRMTDID